MRFQRLRTHLAAPRAPYLAALLFQLAFFGWIKDDAFIEFRYATHLAHGHGLVFNVGDAPVEGFTSFLYTAALALPALAGLDLIVFAKLAGAAAAFGMLHFIGQLVRRAGGDQASATRAQWFAATSPVVIVWAQSGMEGPFAALLVAIVAAEVARGTPRAWLVALAVCGVAVGVRPELHLVAGLVAVAAVWRAARQPAFRPQVALGLAVLAVSAGALIAVRWQMFGHLVPNTALVKLATFSLPLGLLTLGTTFAIGATGALVALSLLWAWARRDAVAWVGAGSLIGFALYIVRVTQDDMGIGRLYAPVLPLACALAGLELARWTPQRARQIAAAICLVGVAFIAGNLRLTLRMYQDDRSQIPLARVLAERGHAGDLVIAQDLGRIPYQTMQLRFVDPIGLVDRRIAMLFQREHASPFVRALSEAGQKEARDYLLGLEPRFIVLVALVVDRRVRRDVERRFLAGDHEGPLLPYVRHNSYHFGLDVDERFARDYRFVDAWQSNRSYYMLLYERR
jgi:hypothetical protein